jgi:MtN3 and saliva related transmembrane protein
MNLISIFAILATISGVAMASAGLPQAIKIFKRESAKDISISSRVILLIGGLIWLTYGVLIINYPIIISNIFGTIAEILVIGGYIKYR